VNAHVAIVPAQDAGGKHAFQREISRLSCVVAEVQSVNTLLWCLRSDARCEINVGGDGDAARTAAVGGGQSIGTLYKNLWSMRSG
jgi:hypothetical protein